MDRDPGWACRRRARELDREGQQGATGAVSPPGFHRANRCHRIHYLDRDIEQARVGVHDLFRPRSDEIGHRCAAEVSNAVFTLFAATDVINCYDNAEIQIAEKKPGAEMSGSRWLPGSAALKPSCVYLSTRMCVESATSLLIK